MYLLRCGIQIWFFSAQQGRGCPPGRPGNIGATCTDGREPPNYYFYQPTSTVLNVRPGQTYVFTAVWGTRIVLFLFHPFTAMLDSNLIFFAAQRGCRPARYGNLDLSSFTDCSVPFAAMVCSVQAAQSLFWICALVVRFEKGRLRTRLRCIV